MRSVGLAVSGLLHAAALAAVMLVALPGSAPVAPESVLAVDLVVLDEGPGRAVPSDAGDVELSPIRNEPSVVETETNAADDAAISLETAAGPLKTPEIVPEGFDVPQNSIADQGEEPPDARLAAVARFQPPRKPSPPVRESPVTADVPQKPVLTAKRHLDGSDGRKAAVEAAPGPSATVTERQTSLAARTNAPGKAAADTVTEARPVGGGVANPAPRYPFSARRRGQEGRVVLRVEVDPAGRAADVSVAHSSGVSALDRAAADAVRRWRFQPARRGGVPVVGRIEVPILFRLDASG